MSRRVFIAGEQGQVAEGLIRSYATSGNIVRSAGRAAVDIVDAAAAHSAIRAFRPDLVVNAAAYPTRNRRPANSRLDSSELARLFGIRMPAWQTSLERCLDQLIGAPHGANV
jgi:dTDP-4-dehydrorhamnose reductase